MIYVRSFHADNWYLKDHRRLRTTLLLSYSLMTRINLSIDEGHFIASDLLVTSA